MRVLTLSGDQVWGTKLISVKFGKMVQDSREEVIFEQDFSCKRQILRVLLTLHPENKKPSRQRACVSQVETRVGFDQWFDLLRRPHTKPRATGMNTVTCLSYEYGKQL